MTRPPMDRAISAGDAPSVSSLWMAEYQFWCPTTMNARTPCSMSLSGSEFFGQYLVQYDGDKCGGQETRNGHRLDDAR